MKVAVVSRGGAGDGGAQEIYPTKPGGDEGDGCWDSLITSDVRCVISRLPQTPDWYSWRG